MIKVLILLKLFKHPLSYWECEYGTKYLKKRNSVGPWITIRIRHKKRLLVRVAFEI